MIIKKQLPQRRHPVWRLALGWHDVILATKRPDTVLSHHIHFLVLILMANTPVRRRWRSFVSINILSGRPVAYCYCYGKIIIHTSCALFFVYQISKL